LIELSGLDREKVDDAVTRIADVAGSGLISIALYGEAATPEYVAGHSPHSLVVLVRDVGAAALAALRPVAVALRRRGMPTPLVVDPEYLERARDVFPLEMLEIRERHSVLTGDADAFSRIEVEASSLRREIEAEARGKLLHLWEDSLTARTRRRLRADLLVSVPYFAHILRGMLYLKSPEGGRSPDVVAAVEREYGLKLPMLARLVQAHRSRATLPLGKVEAMFAAYLDEARALARTADRL
jgi:hypothetical protein